jgi:2-beta-glucuronyltransferase
MKVVLISGHDALSDRKTGFHFWADILDKRGIDVDFITVGSSPISLIRKSGKQLKPPFNKWVRLTDHMRKYTWMPLFHPLNFNNKFLNYLSWPIFHFYPHLMPNDLLASVRNADLFIVENGSGPMLVPKLAKINPKAKFIYNASDRMDVVKFHPIVSKESLDALPLFSMIRLNSAAIEQDFPKEAPTEYIPQAIDKTLFNTPYPNPYKSSRNVISIGDMLFDPQSVLALAKNFPDWNFHLFGKGATLLHPVANVIEYGERPFEDLVPYLQHADIGIAPYGNSTEAEYLSQSSLKLVQYTYCRLPIVTPQFAAMGRDHAFGYSPGVESTLIHAFRLCMKHDRKTIDCSSVYDWDDVIDKMLAVVE